MRRLLFILVLAIFIAGCAPQSTVSTPTQVVETEAPRPSETNSPTEADTPTAEPSPTDEPPTPTTEPSITPTTEQQGMDTWLAYISSDENLWIMNTLSGENVAVTDDAVPFQPGSEEESVIYCCTQWSSDGNLLAFRREVLTPVAQGYESSYSMWIYDLTAGEPRLLLEDQLVFGYAWKPGERLIAYGLPIATEYFIGDKSEYANGIWAVDVESGETRELVPPQRDFALVNPQWSPDGRFLSFEEVQYMEGRGLFAYYDFEVGEYIPWDEAIGDYDWSQDGEQIVYDTLTYIAVGGEGVWLSDRKGEDTQPFSPAFDPGYASHPTFSPQGDRIAYMAAIGGPETREYTLMVQEIGAEEPRELGVFEQVFELIWSGDGTRLVFAAGEMENREIVEVVVEDGTASVLVEGAQPALQP